ncbi:kinase-like domain-containing protein [Gongronella butleri]|nr:kinase-like domain-containing protein [Gongronella butleri]
MERPLSIAVIETTAIIADETSALKSLQVLNVIVQTSSCVLSLVRYLPDLTEFDQLIKYHFKSKVPFPTLAEQQLLSGKRASSRAKRSNSLRKLFRSLSSHHQHHSSSTSASSSTVSKRKTNASKVEWYLQQCLADPVIAQSSVLRDFFSIQRDEDQKLPIKVASPTASQISVVVMNEARVPPVSPTAQHDSLISDHLPDDQPLTLPVRAQEPVHDNEQENNEQMDQKQPTQPENAVAASPTVSDASDTSNESRPLSVKDDMVSLDNLLRDAMSPPLPPSPIVPQDADDAPLSPTESGPNDQQEPVFPLQRFDMLKVLGKGCMGKVLLVRSHATEELYALKKIAKDLVIEQREITHTLTEREILATLAPTRHPNLAHLHLAFQDTHSLYLVTDYLCGGDLATQMSTCITFSKERTRFYAAEMIEGIGELHRLGILYRDLKPENILLTRQGHVVLTDFGLSKWLIDTPYTETFCGTAEYLAPEVLTGEPYSFGIDHWSYGTILYEMLAGITPFWADNHMEMYQRVLEDPLEFPVPDENGMPEFDYDTADFLSQLLERDPLVRLGANGVDEIKNHPYFASLNWDDVYNQRLIPPYVPPLESDMDFANFDATFLDMSPTLTPVGSQVDLSQEMQDVFDDYAFTNGLLAPSINQNEHHDVQSDDVDVQDDRASHMSVDVPLAMDASNAHDDASFIQDDASFTQEDASPSPLFQPARKRGSISMLSDVDSLRLESPLLHGDDDRGVKRRNTQSTAETHASQPDDAQMASMTAPNAQPAQGNPRHDTTTITTTTNSSIASSNLHGSSTLIPESLSTAKATSHHRPSNDHLAKEITFGKKDLDLQFSVKVKKQNGFAANQTPSKKSKSFKASARRFLSPFF